MAEDYTKSFRAVFEWLAKLKLYLKCKNCALFLPVEEFLGYVVSEHGVLVFPGKV